MTDFYTKNAHAYAQTSFSFDMSSLHSDLFTLFQKNHKILELGCGAGRELKAFKENGYDIIGLDACLPLVEIARKHSGCTVLHQSYHDIDFKNEFDGVIAIASLLHADENQLPHVLNKIHTTLKDDGIFYSSFKYGEKNLTDEKGRYFTNMTENKVIALNDALDNKFEIIDISKTGDSKRSRVEWLNITLKK